jgi:cell division protein FtsI (penicillin-binding protein 3)
VEGEGRRYYPRRELAAPLLGFVAPDGKGKDGLEFTQNDGLEGHIEYLRGLRDRAGRLILADGAQTERALTGLEYTLTIDQGLQYIAERELAAAARTFEAAGGSVVVVAPQTGEILAMASWPGFNPNDYQQSDVEQRRNRAITDAFEPGSTMKIFTIGAALSGEVIEPAQKMYCEKGLMPVDNVVIRDTHPSEWLTVSQVLAVSSNICAAKMGLALGGDRLYDMLRRFGFGQEAAVPLPGESAGTLRPRGRPWVQVETASASFGQGISVTNLQLAMATAAIANGGSLMEPILIRRITTASGEVVQEAGPTVRRRVLKPSVARAVAEMMVAVTEGEGTGTGAAINGFQVAGKTATAQKIDPATGRYSVDRYVASFVGFVPANDPVVVIAVVVDEPMVDHAGGAVAAPVFRKVAEHALEYFGRTPRGTERADVLELARQPDPANAAYAALRGALGQAPPVQETVESGPLPAGHVRVPDMTGWTVRAAIRQSLELGVAPRVQGTGLLARQQPPPGSGLPKGEPLTLIFEPAS